MIFDWNQLYFGSTVWQYVRFAFLLLASVVVAKAITWVSKNIIKTFAAKTETKLDDVIVYVLEGPVIFTVFILALHFGRSVLTLPDGAAATFDKIILILWILNAAWYLVRFIEAALMHYFEPLAAKTETDLDDHLLPILKRLVKIAIFAIAVVMIIDRLGFNVSTLVAGLGIGGLAFALAAQDLLGNFFGGISILTDKPFKVGDRIKIGMDVDGTVREIGLRTTRVETLGGTMIVVPNRKVVDSILENITHEKERRVVIFLDLEYDTPSKKLDEAKRLVAANIKRTKFLDNDKYEIGFNEFGASALRVKIVYWITKKGLDDLTGVQDALLSGIKKDFEKARIEFAYPTQTVRIKK